MQKFIENSIQVVEFTGNLVKNVKKWVNIRLVQ